MPALPSATADLTTPPYSCNARHNRAPPLQLPFGIMSSSRGKKVAVPASKKQKGPGGSSSRATTEIRHPFLQFSQSFQEELFQILRARPLGVGRQTGEYRRRQHPRRLLLMEHVARAHAQSSIFHRPCHPAPDRAAPERCDLDRLICHSPRLLLWHSQHSSPGILLHPHRSDIPTGHPKYASHEDDLALIWDRSSTIPSILGCRARRPRGYS
ncbi:hypothetical protein J1N35_035524 [Gossypium stocksii]|uniref:Uncharacterized protein n=1 Tax=Gossypium stocksii TaxID=47602 RepID=A0A9D3ZR15_9ROSI|nr:hypothetical protein J1N35_035524 [Gossypium stocksii]